MNNTVIANSAWDTLSLPEKAGMMKVAVRNGIYNLKDIRDKYNKFAGGGSKKKVVHSINNDATQQAMQYFMGKGLTDYQAAGLVGNLFRESRLNPTATNSGSGAYGIAQWLGSRKKNLFAKYGNNPSLSQQLDYVWHELNNTHKTGLNKLMSSRDSEEAARNAMGYYEFSAGPDAAIREMRRWGQNGERSMQEGINFASQLSGQPIVPYRTENHQLETVPFTPSNPEVFFGNPAAVYAPPTVEVEQPILKAAEDYAYNKQQERKDNLERFNMFMSMLNPSSNNDAFTDTVGLLSFSNRFDAGGPKKPVTKNDLRRMLQRNRAEAETAYNSSIAEAQTVPNDNVWVDKSLTRRKMNPHTERRAVEGAKAHAAWEKEYPNLTAWGNLAGAIPFAVASIPLSAGIVAGGDVLSTTTAGQALTSGLAPLYQAATGATIAGAPALTWADAGLTSAFGAHGIQTAVDDGGISPMTALEIAPLYRPITVAGKVGISKATPTIESFVENHPALYQYPRYAMGKFKYGFDAELPALYRKFRNLPNVENGRVTISNPNNRFAFDNGFGKESPIITNMTTDVPVRSHGLGDWDRDLTLAFPGKTLLGKKVISTRPSDTFTYGDNISVPVKNVVGFTGRPKEITFLQNSGIRSVTSPEAEVFWESGAEDLSKQIGRWRAEQARRIERKGINLGKNTWPSGDFRNYAATIENLTRETFRSPTMKDYEFMDYVFRPKYSSQTIPKTDNFTLKILDEYPLFGEWLGSTERRRYLEQPWRWNNVMYDPLTAAENEFRSSLNIGLKPEYKK